MINVNNINKQRELVKQSYGQPYDKVKYMSKVNHGQHIRILPPHANQNGVYYVVMKQYSFGGMAMITCPSVVGLPDTIAQRKEAVLAGSNEDHKKRVLSDALRVIPICLAPIYMLDCQFDGTGNLTEAQIQDGDYKILAFKSQLLEAFDAIFCNPSLQTGEEDGCIDYEKGYNFIINKTGEGLNTKYSASFSMKPWAVPESFRIPPVDLFAQIRELFIKPEAVIEEVWNAFLVGGNLKDAMVRGYEKIKAGDVDIKVAEPVSQPQPQPAQPKPQPAQSSSITQTPKSVTTQGSRDITIETVASQGDVPKNEGNTSLMSDLNALA